MSDDLLDVGSHAADLARQLGADEVTVQVMRSSYTELSRRDHQVEMAQESRSLSASVALLIDDRYSVHTSSDLRPSALHPFLARAVEATSYLEADPHRRLLPRAQMGSGDVAALEQQDLSGTRIDPSLRRTWAEDLENRSLEAGSDQPIRSLSAYIWDGQSEHAMVCSNGFSSVWTTTNFGHGSMVSLEDADGRLPEGGSFVSCRHFADLPSCDAVGLDAIDRARRRMGSGPCASGRYPMLLENRSAGRILGVLLGPLYGRAIFERRSCMADKLGKDIAAEGFTLMDDPLLKRGLGSYPHDDDGMRAEQRSIVLNGRLQSFFLDVYHARRLERDPTTGGPSNLLVPSGSRSPAAIASGLDKAIRVEGFLGGNSNPATGDFSLGITGTLLEKGEPVQALSEMNISGNIFDLLQRFTEACDDPWRWSSWRTPTLFFDAVQFSGS